MDRTRVLGGREPCTEAVSSLAFRWPFCRILMHHCSQGPRNKSKKSFGSTVPRLMRVGTSCPVHFPFAFSPETRSLRNL